MVTRLGGVVAAVMFVACHAHGPAIPAIPSQGGPAWFELQSEHFTLWSDGTKQQAHLLIKQMEHLRQVVLGVGFQSGNANGRNLVLALRDQQEVNAYIPPQFMAMANSGGAIRQPMIVLPIDAPDGDLPVVTHELTHLISYNVIHNQPRWFAEGLANFFATVDLDPEKAKGKFGVPLGYIIDRLHKNAPTHIATMFACDDYACMNDMFYATAWAMVAFLANAYPQQLLAYADRLDHVTRETMSQAFAEVFPTLTPDEFDRQMRDWLGHGRHTVWDFSVKLQEWPTTERLLSDADVHASRAVLRQMFAKKGDAAPPELALAISADPTELLARLVEADYAKPSVENARKVAAAHSDDWRSWWLLGFAANWEGDDARTAYTNACAIIALRPTGWTPNDWCKK